MTETVNNSLLRVACANMQYGGLDREEGSSRRWDEITGMLGGWQPHIVLLQEMAALHPHELQSRLWATANKLGMTGLINTAVPYSSGGNYPAVLVDYDAGLRITDAGPPSFPPGAGPGNCWCSATVTVPGLPHPLALYSVHMPARTATGQAEQAERLASIPPARRPARETGAALVSHGSRVRVDRRRRGLSGFSRHFRLPAPALQVTGWPHAPAVAPGDAAAACGDREARPAPGWRISRHRTRAAGGLVSAGDLRGLSRALRPGGIRNIGAGEIQTAAGLSLAHPVTGVMEAP